MLNGVHHDDVILNGRQAEKDQRGAPQSRPTSMVESAWVHSCPYVAKIARFSACGDLFAGSYSGPRQILRPAEAELRVTSSSKIVCHHDVILNGRQAEKDPAWRTTEPPQ